MVTGKAKASTFPRLFFFHIFFHPKNETLVIHFIHCTVLAFGLFILSHFNSLLSIRAFFCVVVAVFQANPPSFTVASAESDS